MSFFRNKNVAIIKSSYWFSLLTCALVSPLAVEGGFTGFFSSPVQPKASVNTTKTIITGTDGPCGSVNGIDFNKFNVDDVNLYGCSTVDSKVFIINSQTGVVVDVFGPEIGLLGPDDVAIGPDGKIYYTDTIAGVVGKIDPVTRTVSLVATGLPLVNSIRFSTDGNHLYVGQCFNPGLTGLGDNGLYEIDLATGTKRLISASLDTVPFVGTLSSLNSFDYKDGFIYGPRILTGDVIRVNPTTGVIDGVVATGFVNPSAVQFHEDGKLYVIDANNNKLCYIENPELNNQGTVFVAELPGNSGIDNLAIRKDDVFVSSGNNGYIAQVNLKNGRVKDYLKSDGIVLPMGLVFTLEGHLILGDFNSIREINPINNKIIHSVSTKIVLAPNSNNNIRGLSLGLIDDKVVVADWFGKSIQVWDYNNDTAIATFKPANSPVNVIGFQGTVMSVQFNPSTFTSTLVQYSGPNYNVATTLLTQPGAAFTGLATDGTNLWIADAIGGKIYSYSAGTITPIAKDLAAPEGIALDSDGYHLLVIEAASKKLSSVDLNGTLGSNVTTIEENIPVGYSNGFAPSFFFVSSVTVDPKSNNIYYVGDATRVINCIKR